MEKQYESAHPTIEFLYEIFGLILLIFMVVFLVLVGLGYLTMCLIDECDCLEWWHWPKCLRFHWPKCSKFYWPSWLSFHWLQRRAPTTIPCDIELTAAERERDLAALAGRDSDLASNVGSHNSEEDSQRSLLDSRQVATGY